MADEQADDTGAEVDDTADVPERVRAAERRRAFRDLLDRSSIGQPAAANTRRRPE